MNRDCLERFKVNEALLESIVAKGLGKGGGWCDLYFQDSVSWELVLRDGVVGSGGLSDDYGCGIRVLDGEKTGYAYTEVCDRASLLRAAEDAASIACGSVVTSWENQRSDGRTPGLYYPAGTDPLSSSPASLIPWLEKLESRIRTKEPSTAKVMAMAEFTRDYVMMYNSLGELTFDDRPVCSVAVTAVFQRGKQVETDTASRSFRCGVEMFTDSLIEELAAEVCASVDNMFEARKPKGGKMKVVMGAGASGILLHEAMGHSFEADCCRKGQSIFSDKLGSKICRKGINIVDDGTIPGNRGSCRYDDEGVPGQKTYMVTDGVLSSFLHDRISARWYGVSPTGNGRRESFRYNPIPRMRATYMESGSDGTLQDLIASVDKGIFVDKFSNGQVKIGEGDFTFYVKSGSLIEKGRLTMPVKDINIIGNGPKALSDIEAVASDLVIDNGQWTCGKEQEALVSCGIPSVLINNLTVGGI